MKNITIQLKHRAERAGSKKGILVCQPNQAHQTKNTVKTQVTGGSMCFWQAAPCHLINALERRYSIDSEEEHQALWVTTSTSCNTLGFPLRSLVVRTQPNPAQLVTRSKQGMGWPVSCQASQPARTEGVGVSEAHFHPMKTSSLQCLHLSLQRSPSLDNRGLSL